MHELVTISLLNHPRVQGVFQLCACTPASYQVGRRADTQSTPKPAVYAHTASQSDKETTEKGPKNPEQLGKVSIFTAFSIIRSKGQEMKPVGITLK